MKFTSNEGTFKIQLNEGEKELQFEKFENCDELFSELELLMKEGFGVGGKQG